MGTEIRFFPFTQNRPAAGHHELTRHRDLAIAVLAHELRGPLSAIVNAVNILRQKGADGDTFTWACDMVERQARLIGAHVDDLLDVSRAAVGKVQLQVKLVALNTVVRNAVRTARPLIESRDHHLEVELPSGDLWLVPIPTASSR